MCDFTDGESVEEGTTQQPTVNLGFNNDATDTGTLGLTWEAGTDVSYDETSFSEGTHSLKRTTPGSTQGLKCNSPALVFDYSKSGTLQFEFANLAKPVAGNAQVIYGTTATGINIGFTILVDTLGKLTCAYRKSAEVKTVAGSADVSGSPVYKKARIEWNIDVKKFEFFIDDVSQGISAAITDHLPTVVNFHILGDAVSSAVGAAGNVDKFKVYSYEPS